jgi:multisubunit Na+/H+ antiporter MnhG subunit
MQYWKFLHILSMFTAVTLLVGISVFGGRVIATRDLAAIRRFGVVYPPLERAGIAAASLGVIFGLITAIVGPWDLTEGWLVTAYVLVVALFALGPVEGRMFAKVAEAAGETDGDEPKLAALLADRRRPTLTLFSIVLYVAVIFTMVTKPFS